MAVINVDGKTYKTKVEALRETLTAIMYTDGSERERMRFAYDSIQNGCTVIDTYKETAI